MLNTEVKRRNFILVTATALLISGTSIVSTASDNWNQKSKGRIEFDNDTAQKDDDVVFDMDDVTQLAYICR